jgi:hypothetical protein
MKKISGMFLLVIGLSGVAFALQCNRGCGAPEINPSSGASALALLSGAVLLVRGRRQK